MLSYADDSESVEPQLYLYMLLSLQPVGASDYLMMSKVFHTVLIRDVPRLNMKVKSQARRFITLIDTLYDNRVSFSSVSSSENLQRMISTHFIAGACRNIV